jgi:hypothetical protein
VSTTVTWLGHSSVVLDVDGVRLVADPLLRRNAGPLRRRGGAPTRALWDGADAVLLSHLHHDHAELRSLRMLPAGVPVITGARNVPWLRKRGLAAVAPLDRAGIEVGPGSGVRVALCAADHSARPMPHRPNAANGHLVRAPSARIWVAGDTALYEGLSNKQAGRSTSHSSRCRAGGRDSPGATWDRPRPPRRAAVSGPRMRSRCTGEPSTHQGGGPIRAAGWTARAGSSRSPSRQRHRSADRWSWTSGARLRWNRRTPDPTASRVSAQWTSSTTSSPTGSPTSSPSVRDWFRWCSSRDPRDARVTPGCRRDGGAAPLRR